MPDPREKQEREAEVAELFCRQYARGSGVPAHFLRNLPEPAADVLIEVGQQEICMELARYRETGPFNATIEYDSQLKHAILERVLGDGSLPECSVTFQYRESMPGHYRVPRPDRRAAFIAEYVDVVRRFERETPADCAAKVIFVSIKAPPKTSRAGRRQLFVTSEEAPVLAEFCASLTIRRTPGVPMGLPGSSMNCRSTRADWDEIKRMIAAKLDNLPAYRLSAAGRPVWLLYYGEGNATGRLPGAEHNAQLTTFLQSLMAQSHSRFDAVWWADETYSYRGPTLYQVV